MSTMLELVYQYRHLIGKCEASIGLDVDEIDTLHTIEAIFDRERGPDREYWRCQREDPEAVRPQSRPPCQRRFNREKVNLGARLRAGERIDQQSRIIDIAPGGMVCANAPYVEEGGLLEIVVDDPELSLSYRFKAVVVWLRDGDYDDFLLGLELVGVPLLVRYGPQNTVRELAEPIAA